MTPVKLSAAPAVAYPPDSYLAFSTSYCPGIALIASSSDCLPDSAKNWSNVLDGAKPAVGDLAILAVEKPAGAVGAVGVVGKAP